MQKKLSWQAFSNSCRNEVIELVKNTISKNDGYIMNFNMFSDLAMSLSLEIEENKIANLHNSLKEILSLSELESETINSTSTKEWMIFINLSFNQGKGDLKFEIPSVPG